MLVLHHQETAEAVNQRLIPTSRILAMKKKDSRWDEDDDLPLKADTEKPSERNSTNARPTRTSKTLSKYYKGPTSKSHHSMGTRSTRQR